MRGRATRHHPATFLSTRDPASELEIQRGRRGSWRPGPYREGLLLDRNELTGLLPATLGQLELTSTQ